jgi:hypothetical protein
MRYFRRGSALAAVLFGLVFISGCASSGDRTSKDVQIPLPNGDFETGALGPWAPYLAVQAAIGKDQVHGGKFCLTESSANGSVYQDIKGLQVGGTYVISAWVSALPGATATAQIAVWDPGTNLAVYSPPTLPQPAWQLVKQEAKASSQGLLRIHLFRNAGAGTILWDDVQISLKP